MPGLAGLRWCWPSVRANHLTVFAGVFGVGVLLACALGHPLIAVLCLWISGWLDTADGALARSQNDSSSFGTVLDIVMDRVVESLAVVGLLCLGLSPYVAVAMLVSILWCVSSFLVVGMVSENDSEKHFHYSPGWMERAEAFLFFTAMLCWPAAANVLGGVFAGLTVATAVKRVGDCWHHGR